MFNLVCLSNRITRQRKIQQNLNLSRLDVDLWVPTGRYVVHDFRNHSSLLVPMLGLGATDMFAVCLISLAQNEMLTSADNLF